MFIIATGDAFDGLVLWGPFETMEEAHEWGEVSLDDWVCVMINPVKGANSSLFPIHREQEGPVPERQDPYKNKKGSFLLFFRSIERSTRKGKGLC